MEYLTFWRVGQTTRRKRSEWIAKKTAQIETLTGWKICIFWRGWSQESGVRSSEFGVRSSCPESQVRAIGHIVDAAGLTFRSVFVGNGLALLLPIFFEVFSSRAELSGCLWEQSASINVYWLRVHLQKIKISLFKKQIVLQTVYICTKVFV